MATNNKIPYQPLSFQRDLFIRNHIASFTGSRKFPRVDRREPLGSRVLTDLESARAEILGGNLAKKSLQQKKKRTTCGSPQVGSCELNDTSPEYKSSPFDLLSSDDGQCDHLQSNLGKARACLRLLRTEHSTVPERGVDGPIHCGELRAAVRQCYPASIPLELELSIKTSGKLELDCCDICADKHDVWLSDWKTQRLQAQDVDTDHLEEFKKIFSGNVPEGWNRRKHAYIPNGHGTYTHKRREGGNWNREEFSEDCRLELVYSSGKPRIVTLFSEYNSRVLTPLHLSLYAELERYGWLLVGPPTTDDVAWLNGGDYLSVDYQSATDNIKMVYVRAAIECLIARAVGLSDDEKRCLRVLGNLRLDGECLQSCQPMGSLMSFPLLCLVNKTVVDMSLNDLMLRREVTFKEWKSHRCLINGDDLLVREVRTGGSLFRLICYHGSMVGLRTNEEKTMRSSDLAEINSTLFKCTSSNSGRVVEKVRKTNCSVLYPGTDVNDVLGFAAESVRTLEGFKMAVTRERARFCLSRQVRKLPSTIKLSPGHLAVIRKNRQVRHAVMSVPGPRKSAPNPFPMIDYPVSPDLSVDERVFLLEKAVNSVRDTVLGAPRFRPGFVNIVDVVPFRRALRKRNHRCSSEMECLVDGWEILTKEKNLDKMAIVTQECDQLGISDHNLSARGSKIQRMIDFIKCNKGKKGCGVAVNYFCDNESTLKIYDDPG